MNTVALTFHGCSLLAMASGALFVPDAQTLVVSDLHFGKSARPARWGGAGLPPYDMRETLQRLEKDIEATAARQVICLGDSFDAPGLDQAMPEAEQIWLMRLMAGRDWVWIEGNHDPGPVSLGGRHLAELQLDGLVFRHIARPDAAGEVSGHYHPKARLSLRGRRLSRPCFLVDRARLLMPAYGTYTGGLCCSDPQLQALMRPEAQAILTGPRVAKIPMPRTAA